MWGNMRKLFLAVLAVVFGICQFSWLASVLDKNVVHFDQLLLGSGPEPGGGPNELDGGGTKKG